MEAFDWDNGNLQKAQKHGHSPDEIESVFRDEKAVVRADAKHSGIEERFNIVGKSQAENYLYITFTIRDEKIRPISVRKAKDKEKRAFGYPD